MSLRKGEVLKSYQKQRAEKSGEESSRIHKNLISILGIFGVLNCDLPIATGHCKYMIHTVRLPLLGLLTCFPRSGNLHIAIAVEV